jgi:raffinose/stachyose/melibiose transport system substrate-binding protein
MRPLSVVAAAVALTAGLAGCATSSSSSSGSSGTAQTVTVWSWRSQDAPIWKTVQTDLAKQGTNVNIKFRAISATSYDSVLQTAMNGGSGPDIFYDRAGEGTQTYAAAGLAKSLNGAVDTSLIKGSALAAAQYKGKTYGVPFAIQTMSVFYNKALLKSNGVSVPTTWNGFLGAMKTLKSKGVTPMYTMGVQPWMLALQMDAVGASAMDDSFTKALTAKTANYTGQPYQDTLKAFQQLAPYLQDNWEATGSAGNEQETAFALGKCAFIIDGIFDTATIRQVNPTMDIGQMLVPSPTGGQAKIDWYTDGNISMNNKIASSAESKAAEKVVAFTATKAFGNAFSDVAGEISPISGVQVPAKYPLSVQAAKWYNDSAINPIFGIRSPMDTPNPDPSSLTKKTAATVPGIFTAEQNVAVPLLEGKTTPAQAAASVQSTLKWYFGAK